MELKIATSFSWLILLVFLTRPVCMQVLYDAGSSSVCSPNTSFANKCLNIPTHQWDVELPDCSADSVRVVYSNYRGEDGMSGQGTLTYQEIQLHCTAPGGTAQAEVMPASINCSGTSTGGNWKVDGFVFQNLGAAGIQSGWTCTISGCFSLEVGRHDDWIQTPSTEFVLRSGRCDPVTEAPTTTMSPTTTEILPTTTHTAPATTTVSPTTTESPSIFNLPTTMITTDLSTTDSTTETTKSGEGTQASMAITSNGTATGTDAVQDTDLVKEMYAVMISLITVLLVALFTIITLIVFAALCWRKLQRDRKRAILIIDKKNMVFDPNYVPAVSIEKPLSHRISVVSNDFLQFLSPHNNGSLHGNEKMDILLEGSSDGGDDVLLQHHDTTSHVTDTNYVPREFSGGGSTTRTQAEDPPPDYSSVHSDLLTHHGEVLGYVLENNRQSNITIDGHSVSLSRNHEAAGTNLDKHYNSSSVEYVDSNMSPLLTAPQGLDNQPASSNIFELEMESDSSQSKALSSISVLKSADATSYTNSAPFGLQNTHGETSNLDLPYLDSDDSGLGTHSLTNLSSPLTFSHNHTTDTDGYVSNGQTPPTDRRRSGEQNESLELDFVTESDSYSTGAGGDEQCLVSLTLQDPTQPSAPLPTQLKNRDLKYSSSPDDSAQSQVHKLTSLSASNPEFLVHLDFDSQADADMPNFENTVHEHKDNLQVPVTGGRHLLDDNSPQDDGERGQYIVYDFQPMRHLLSDISGTDCLSAIVPESQSSDKVKVQPQLVCYPSDTSSGYVSGSIN